MSCRPSAPRVASVVDDLFVSGRVAGWRFRRMWRHLGECEACRGYFDRVAVAWRALGKSGEPPQIAEALAGAVIDSLPREAVARSRGSLFTFGALAAAAVLAIALFVGVGALGHHGQGTWIERGGSGPARARGVHAFCIARSGGEPTIRADARFAPAAATTKAELRCHAGDELQLAYSLGDGAAESLAVTALDALGQLHEWQPRVALHPGAIDEPLAGSIRLASQAPGHLALTARFDGSADAQALDLLIEP